MRRVLSSWITFAVIVAAIVVFVLWGTCGSSGSVSAGSPARSRIVVGVARSNDACPQKSTRWHVEPLFNKGPIPDAMRGYCVYEWQGADPPDYAGLPTAELTSAAESPPLVASLQAPAVTRAIELGQLRESFMKRAPGVDLVPSGGIVPIVAGDVTIGFADTSPDAAPGKISEGADPHGFNMASIARHLVCPGGPTSCPVAPFMRLALPRTTPVSVANAAGGAFGTTAELAVAIKSLVDDAPAGHLVINLSVAWEPRHDAKEPGPACAVTPALLAAPHAVDDPVIVKGDKQERIQPAPVNVAMPAAAPMNDPVYLALTYAACHGALIVAAAGNDPGYAPPLEGPMCPAAWEQLPAPSPKQCADLLKVPVASVVIDPAPHPLVYAAGGIGDEDGLLPTSRHKGTPRLVAVGELGVAYEGNAPPAPSRALTGTSVSTAVVSASVAAVWSRSPSLAVTEVMAQVYGKAAPLAINTSVPANAEFCFGAAPCPAPRRVSPCFALGDPGCVDTLGPFPLTAGPALGQGHDCGAGALDPACQLPAAVAPATFPANLVGIVYGQPPYPICPDCLIDASVGQPYINVTIDPTYFTTEQVTMAAGLLLNLYDSRGAVISVYDGGNNLVSPQRLAPGWSDGTQNVNQLYNDRVTVPLGAASAMLAWNQTIGGTTSLATQSVPIRR